MAKDKVMLWDNSTTSLKSVSRKDAFLLGKKVWDFEGTITAKVMNVKIQFI